MNKRPTYTEPINDNNQTSDTELTKNDFEQFWRPIWEENKETNLDAKWIKEVKEAINEVIPPPSDDLITIQESDIKSSICSKKNWSSPGVDKITNYWMKKITEAHEGLAIALTKIINNEQSLPQWLCEGKCIMIPKTENPKAKDHRPITLLNTMYKLVTSVIDARLRKHQGQYNYMQIDQRGCTTGSMGCVDNLLIDKAVQEDAQFGRKNLSCTWIDVKKAFDSINHNWLKFCLQIHSIPTKIAQFISNTIKHWKITLEVKTAVSKEYIGPIQLKQGILQGDSFCVRLFTVCLNPIAWHIRSTEGYSLSQSVKEKITHLLYVDDLKTYHKSHNKAALMARALKDKFQDIGLYWGLDKCATVNVVRGKIVQSTNVSLNNDEQLRTLDKNDKYKFLGKYENSTQLDDIVCEEVSEEFLKRLTVIWSSNISIPRKVKASNTFALPMIQYHMWSSDWPINTLKQLDRECRKIIQEYGGLHVSESTKVMYLPTKEGGRGLKEVEMTYKVTKIKTANYIIHSQDPRIQLVKRFEERKATKGLKSVLKDAKKYAEELDVAFTYDETKTTLTSQGKTTEVEKASPKLIGEFLTPIINNRYKTEYKDQKWLGALTTLQYDDVDIAADSLALLQTWKNIPDIVLSVNTSIRQQLLPTATYKKYKLHQQVEDIKCRMCGQKQETVSHIMCACSTIAQSLYTSRHDKMLRPFYHYLLHLYDFENDHSKPWYEQRPPSAVIENDKAKIMWNTAFYLPEPPEDGANKIDMALHDIQKKEWLLLEGTVCGIGKIADRTSKKQMKYRDLRSGIKQMYPQHKVTQVNIVFDFLGNYYKDLKTQVHNHVILRNTDKQQISSKITSEKETRYLLQKSQKWILSQNVEIVKRLYRN